MIKPFFDPWFYDLNAYKELIFWKYTIRHWVYDNPRELVRWIKSFCQRGSRGWADRDVWEMHGYLCDVILPMLKRLKEEKHGVPCDLDENFDVAVKKWDANMDDMIAAFEAAKRVIEDEYCSEEWDKVMGDSDVKEMLSNLDRKEVHNVAQKSFKLSKKDQKLFYKKAPVFIKWFFSLWD